MPPATIQDHEAHFAPAYVPFTGHLLSLCGDRDGWYGSTERLRDVRLLAAQGTRRLSVSGLISLDGQKRASTISLEFL